MNLAPMISNVFHKLVRAGGLVYVGDMVSSHRFLSLLAPILLILTIVQLLSCLPC